MVTNAVAVGVFFIAGELACTVLASVLGMVNIAFGIAGTAVVWVRLEIDADAVTPRQTFFAHAFCRSCAAFLGFGIAEIIFAAALGFVVRFAFIFEEEKAFGAGIRDTDGIATLTAFPARETRTVDFVIPA